MIPREPELGDELEVYWDNSKGGYFAELHKYKVYEKRLIAECIAVTGKKPIGIRWVDTNKGVMRTPSIAQGSSQRI